MTPDPNALANRLQYLPRRVDQNGDCYLDPVQLSPDQRDLIVSALRARPEVSVSREALRKAVFLEASTLPDEAERDLLERIASRVVATAALLQSPGQPAGEPTDYKSLFETAETALLELWKMLGVLGQNAARSKLTALLASPTEAQPVAWRDDELEALADEITTVGYCASEDTLGSARDENLERLKQFLANGNTAPPVAMPSESDSDAVNYAQFMFGVAERAYLKAGETSDPQDWLQAGLLAQQHRNALKRCVQPVGQSPAMPSESGYRAAVEEKLISAHLGVASGDARADLHKLISWEVEVALDPRVSERAAALTAMPSEVREALEHYSDQYCEGWCRNAPTRTIFEDCGGCKARAILASAKETS